MVTFKTNLNRRGNFRRGDRNFKSSNDRKNYSSQSFSPNDTFQKKIHIRNGQNASKLLEKYNNLAREALSNGDKILSENYFQHADHFVRVINSREEYKKNKETENIDTSLKITNTEDKSKITSSEKNDKVVSEVS